MFNENKSFSFILCRIKCELYSKNVSYELFSMNRSFCCNNLVYLIFTSTFTLILCYASKLMSKVFHYNSPKIFFWWNQTLASILLLSNISFISSNDAHSLWFVLLKYIWQGKTLISIYWYISASKVPIISLLILSGQIISIKLSWLTLHILVDIGYYSLGISDLSCLVIFSNVKFVLSYFLV